MCELPTTDVAGIGLDSFVYHLVDLETGGDGELLPAVLAGVWLILGVDRLVCVEVGLGREPLVALVAGEWLAPHVLLLLVAPEAADCVEYFPTHVTHYRLDVEVASDDLDTSRLKRLRLGAIRLLLADEVRGGRLATRRIQS
jgi:hypothetical protein